MPSKYTLIFLHLRGDHAPTCPTRASELVSLQDSTATGAERRQAGREDLDRKRIG